MVSKQDSLHLQSVSGAFAFDERLAAALRFPSLAALREACTRVLKPVVGDITPGVSGMGIAPATIKLTAPAAPAEERVWATAVALAALELWYSGDASQREAWALIARRATAWLTHNGAGEYTLNDDNAATGLGVV